MLEQHTQVIELAGDTDYRLRLLRQAGTYLTPEDDNAQIADAGTLFRRPGLRQRLSKTTRLQINGREIETVRCAKGIAWFDFAELCNGPRSQQDYIELARWYQTVILSGVPVLDARQEDPGATVYRAGGRVL